MKNAEDGGCRSSATLWIPQAERADRSGIWQSIDGTTSSPLIVTVTNNQSFNLNALSISVNGNFSINNTCSTKLGPGASCTIGVTFTPKDLGMNSGTLTVTDDAPGSPQKVDLAGTGTTN